jgi:hypothetical protein
MERESLILPQRDEIIQAFFIQRVFSFDLSFQKERSCKNQKDYGGIMLSHSHSARMFLVLSDALHLSEATLRSTTLGSLLKKYYLNLHFINRKTRKI